MSTSGRSGRSGRRRSALRAIAVLLIAGACTGSEMRVESEARPGAAFAGYATYCWRRPPLPVREPPSPAAVLDWRVRNAVDAELSDKGYRKGLRPPCDFLVDYGVRFSERQVDSFSEFADYKARGGKGGLQDVLPGYEEGTLSLQILDGSSGELVWHAAASAVTDRSRQEERVPEGVRRMLEGFPSRGAARR